MMVHVPLDNSQDSSECRETLCFVVLDQSMHIKLVWHPRNVRLCYRPSTLEHIIRTTTSITSVHVKNRVKDLQNSFIPKIRWDRLFETMPEWNHTIAWNANTNAVHYLWPHLRKAGDLPLNDWCCWTSGQEFQSIQSLLEFWALPQRSQERLQKHNLMVGQTLIC